MGLLAANGAAQQFTNGNFAGNANGWTFADVDFGGGYKNGIGSDGTNGFAFLNNAGQANTFPRVTQTVTGFVVGRNYRVSGYIHTGVFFYAGDVFQALLDGSIVFNGPNMLLGQWTPFSYVFLASAGSHTFSFRAEVTSDSDWDLDTLSIAAVSSVSGHAFLDGYTGSAAGQLLQVEVWQGGALVETLDGHYAPGNTFSFVTRVSGSATLKFRLRTGLWKAVSVTLGNPITNLTVGMTNGDCDHDNEVSIGDYAILSQNFNRSLGDVGYDSNADLNGDDTVDIGDYAILSGSFGQVGD
jgi:hypothetical protein